MPTHTYLVHYLHTFCYINWKKWGIFSINLYLQNNAMSAEYCGCKITIHLMWLLEIASCINTVEVISCDPVLFCTGFKYKQTCVGMWLVFWIWAVNNYSKCINIVILFTRYPGNRQPMCQGCVYLLVMGSWTRTWWTQAIWTQGEHLLYPRTDVLGGGGYYGFVIVTPTASA